MFLACAAVVPLTSGTPGALVIQASPALAATAPCAGSWPPALQAPSVSMALKQHSTLQQEHSFLSMPLPVWLQSKLPSQGYVAVLWGCPEGLADSPDAVQ